MAPATHPPEGLRERNKRRRVEEILAAARELLREAPGQSPSVERIAERAAVAPATVFNLVGTRERIWAALADQGMARLDERLGEAEGEAPQARARWIALAIVDVICADADVYRTVLAHWSESGRLLRQDPTRHLVACLREAREAGQLDAGADERRLAELIATGCTGAVQQWAAGILDDDGLRERCAAMVDLAFGTAPRRR